MISLMDFQIKYHCPAVNQAVKTFVCTRHYVDEPPYVLYDEDELIEASRKQLYLDVSKAKNNLVMCNMRLQGFTEAVERRNRV